MIRFRMKYGRMPTLHLYVLFYIHIYSCNIFQDKIIYKPINEQKNVVNICIHSEQLFSIQLH